MELDIENIVKEAVMQAIDFVESEISEDRIKAQRYFDGEVDIGHEDGRSKVVATKVRDAVRRIKPSLMRVFMTTENAVEFVPRNPQTVPQAEMATKYVNYLWNEAGGYRVLNDVFHDALIKRVGVAKVYWENEEEKTHHDFSNLSDEELTLLMQEPNIEVVSHEQNELGHTLKIIRKAAHGELCVKSVPPEEFFIDRGARSIDDFTVAAHRTEMTVGELVEMGYDFDEMVSLAGSHLNDTMEDAEEYERSGYIDDEDESNDPSMREVEVIEAYMKVDVEGTGVPEMYQFRLAGGKLIDQQPYDEAPFAIFEVDPEPHTFYGRSIADLLLDEQDASTAMLRGVLDNVALTNNPRTAILDGYVEVDDVLNNEIGSIVRERQAGAIRPLTVPFVAGETLLAIQYMDNEIESKTGVTRASAGLDPDALQNTTATAAQLTAQGAAGQVEVMARNLAEGGMKRLFKLILKLVIENSSEPQMMRVAGSDFVPVDPRSWDAELAVSVNVGIGTGQHEQRTMALMKAIEFQSQIMQAYGVQNGLVSLTNVRNALADLLASNGVRNADRYFNPMNPQIEQQMMQQAAQNQQPPQPDQQSQAYLQAEQMKTQARAQSDQMKLHAEVMKFQREDDRKRDEMDQNLLIEAAKIIGQYGTAVDIERIKQMQAQPRIDPMMPRV